MIDYHLDNLRTTGSYERMTGQPKMTKQSNSETKLRAQPVWAEGLRRMYDAVVDEKIPDEFVELLKQLDQTSDEE